MFMAKIFCVLLMLVCAVFGKSISNNQPAVLTTYAKVANFGNSNTTADEGRSSGQSFYTQSSDARIMAGQNLKNKVVYYVAKPSRVGEDDTETLPAKGEVQERFHPRPYFDYLETPKRQNKPDPKPTDMSKPSVVYGAPFNSFPVFNDQPPSPDSQVDTKPSDFNSNSPVYIPPQNNVKSPAVDLYNSPYDSYNPNPQSKPDSTKDVSMQTSYPPLAYGPPSETFMPTPAKPDSSPKDMFDSYMNTGPKSNPPPKDMYDSYTSAGSKPDMMEDDKNQYPGYPYAPTELDHPPKQDEMFMSAPPDKDASHEDMSAEGPPIAQTVKPPYQYNYHHHHHHDHNPPPPADSSEDSSQEDMRGPMNDDDYGKPPAYAQSFPKDHGYNYPDDHYFDDHHHHHVYHEITTTTTTTEAPEDKRVNNNYSYYYLGRKLWYIPLYFSIYFMFYIAALILKSIARHKVNFWSTLPSNSRSARNMEFNKLTSNVTNAIEQVETKYMM